MGNFWKNEKYVAREQKEVWPNYIHQHIFKEAKARRENVAIAWINNRKANDMVLQSRRVDYLEICKISRKIINLITNAIDK